MLKVIEILRNVFEILLCSLERLKMIKKERCERLMQMMKKERYT